MNSPVVDVIEQEVICQWYDLKRVLQLMVHRDVNLTISSSKWGYPMLVIDKWLLPERAPTITIEEYGNKLTVTIHPVEPEED